MAARRLSKTYTCNIYKYKNKKSPNPKITKLQNMKYGTYTYYNNKKNEGFELFEFSKRLKVFWHVLSKLYNILLF